VLSARTPIVVGMLDNTLKECSRCRVAKPHSEFGKNARMDDQLDYYCLDCRRANKLKQRYKVTPEDYDRMYEEQGGVCRICHKECCTGKRLAVDHCHETGKVRGLLCSNCNRGIGHLQDSVELLLRAADYLRNSQDPL
jgi:nitrate/TMAO reductase-like tetraheme cytochrome c subunit